MDSTQHHGSQIPKMIWTVVTPIIFSVGIIGNIITIIVLQKNRNKSSTAVYLTVLAVADLLVLTISLPRWWIIYMFGLDVRHLSNGMCKLHWFLTYFDISVSTCILMTVTIERVISTVKPLKMKSLCTVKSALAISLTIILAMVIMYAHLLYGLKLFHTEVSGEKGTRNINDKQLPTANSEVITNLTKPTLNGTLFNNITDCSISNTNYTANGLTLTFPNPTLTSEEDFTNNTANCSSLTFPNTTSTNREDFTNNSSTQLIRMCWFSDPAYGEFYTGTFQIMSLLSLNIIPQFVIFIGGVVIIRMLTVNRNRVAPARAGHQSKTKANENYSKQITLSLLLVNIVFFICTTPVCIFLLGRSAWIDSKKGMTVTQEIIWAVLNMIYYTNHAVNFILYFLSGARFRRQALDTVCCRKHTGANTTTFSHSHAQSTV